MAQAAQGNGAGALRPGPSIHRPSMARRPARSRPGQQHAPTRQLSRQRRGRKLLPSAQARKDSSSDLPNLQPFNSVDQLLLVRTQRTNAEADGSAANDETLGKLSGGPLRPRSFPPHSTVTLFARFLGLSTSVPLATAVWYDSSCRGTTCSRGDSAP